MIVLMEGLILGVWGIGLFDNDLSCDIKDCYIKWLKQSLDKKKILLQMKDEFSELFGTEEEPIFWYVMAHLQIENGYLLDEVKKNALSFMSFDESDCSEEYQVNMFSKEQINIFKEQINSYKEGNVKCEKDVTFESNPWNVGDVYAYKFQSKKAVDCDLFSKYILFQKIGDVEYFQDTVYSVVQIFNEVFEKIPTIDEVDNIDILPLINPPGVNGTPNHIEDYVPSFEWFSKATMIYEKKSMYPRKSFIYVGRQQITPIKCAGNDFTDFILERSGMEDWLIDYYLNWKTEKDGGD